MRRRLTTNRFFDGLTLHGPTLIETADDMVTDVSPHEGDTEHALISPGFVDVQMNGFDAVDVASCTRDEFLQMDALLAEAGTTSWLATIVTAPLERLSEVIARLDGWVRANDTGCAGIHVEGPFLGRAPGAHNPRWIVDVDLDWIASLPSSVRLVTLAPEQTRCIDAVHALRERRIAVSIGHSRCSDAEFTAAVGAGAGMATHVFNGMSGVHHRDEGVALCALTDDRVVAGLIGDGVHVSARAASLVFRAKPAGGVCLVSDSIGWRGPWARKLAVEVRDGAPRLPDGTLAGTSVALAECVQRVVRDSGVSVEAALAAATTTPASLIGYPQTGTIAVGSPADIVCLDEGLHVREVHRRLVSQRGSRTD